MALVSIVILSYNGFNETTKPCINSVLRNTEGDYELIVVDNASKDETQASLRTFEDRNEHVRVQLNDTNKGFAEGNNNGIRMANKNYIILLNNDTLVPEGWLDRLIRRFQEHDKIGLIGPVTNSAGNEQSIDLGNLNERNYSQVAGDYIEKQSGVWFSTEKLGFFCVAIRKAVIEKVGLLDEGFGIGMFEDDDYCLRARQAGYTLAIVEDCFVYHKGSVSFKKLPTTQYQETFNRNRLYYLKKNGVLWTYTDIAYNIWQKILDDISLYETTCDKIVLERVLSRLTNMTGALYQLKLAEENQVIADNERFAEIKSNQDQQKLMEISDWATSLKQANDQLTQDYDHICSELSAKELEVQKFKNSFWYNIYKWWGGKAAQT